MSASMRIALLIALLMLTSHAQSNEAPEPIPPVAPKAKRANKPENKPNHKQTITVEFPATINVTVRGKLETKSEDAKAKADRISKVD